MQRCSQYLVGYHAGIRGLLFISTQNKKPIRPYFFRRGACQTIYARGFGVPKHPYLLTPSCITPPPGLDEASPYKVDAYPKIEVGKDGKNTQ